VVGVILYGSIYIPRSHRLRRLNPSKNRPTPPATATFLPCTATRLTVQGFPRSRDPQNESRALVQVSLPLDQKACSRGLPPPTPQKKGNQGLLSHFLRPEKQRYP